MQGSYRGEALRRHQRVHWARDVVPVLVAAETQPLRELVRKASGIVALDAGANKGFWAKALLHAFGDAVAHIHMFDPSPENYRELCERTDNMIFGAADFPKLSAHGLALGATRGIATLHTNDDGSPLASLYRHELNPYSHPAMAALDLKQSFDVPMDTIDNFMTDRSIAYADILKIDVEGHEMDVLKGAEKALAAGGIGTVAFEFGMHQVESRNFFVDFYRLLTGYGYAMYLAQDGSLAPIPRYEYRYENFTDNFIFMASRETPHLLHEPRTPPKPLSPRHRLRRLIGRRS